MHTPSSWPASSGIFIYKLQTGVSSANAKYTISIHTNTGWLLFLPSPKRKPFFINFLDQKFVKRTALISCNSFSFLVCTENREEPLHRHPMHLENWASKLLTGAGAADYQAPGRGWPLPIMGARLCFHRQVGISTFGWNLLLCNVHSIQFHWCL